MIAIIIASGSYLISIIPSSVQATFQFVVPAIFGGILAQFAIKNPLYGLIAVITGIVINLTPIIPFFRGIICIAITITICLYLEKVKARKNLSLNLSLCLF